MNFTELYRWFSEILERGHLPALLTGTVSGLAAGFALARLFRKALFLRLRVENAQLKAEVSRLRGRDEQRSHLVTEKDGRIATLICDGEASRREAHVLNGQLGERRTKSEELSAACEALRDEQQMLQRRVKRLRRRLKVAEVQVKAQAGQLDAMTKSDGKIWGRRPVGSVAPFVPLSIRRTPIISVVNFKGGVGKTTITANLGAAFGMTGRRVLLVDLDHQGSLTSHYIGNSDLYVDARKARRMIEDAFRDGREGLDGLHRSILRMPEIPVGEVFLLGADDKFSDVETQLMERWLSRSTTDDIRYRLRHVLHDSTVTDRFDLILLDCPPRLTTGCINALTASDSILVPVLPEEKSTEAVPRLFEWIKALRPDVCPELTVLGVVGNKGKYYGDRVVGRQRLILDSMADECRAVWGEPVRQFAPIKVHEVHATKHAALDPKYRLGYRKLVDAITEEMPNYARLRASGVPSVVGRAAEGVGS